MQVSAITKYIRMSPQKVRLVVDQVRGLSVARALDVLRMSNRSAALPVRKTLESAIANAENNEGADIDELSVEAAYVNVGPTLKRFRARAKGRGARILKRSSHITITVGDGRGED